MAEFVEDLHPRAGRGVPGGGRFVAKGGSSSTAVATAGWELDDDDRSEIEQYTQYQNTQQAIDAIKDGSLGDGIDEITTDHKHALQYYTGPGHTDINRSLRAGLLDSDQMPDFLEQTIRTLDAMMAESSLADDTVLFRSYSSGSAKQLENLKPGDVVLDKGFTSTTTNEAKLGAAPMSIKILAPVGSRAIVVENSFKTHQSAEEEVILDRNSRLEYIGEENGQKVFRLRQDQSERKT